MPIRIFIEGKEKIVPDVPDIPVVPVI